MWGRRPDTAAANADPQMEPVCATRTAETQHRGSYGVNTDDA